MQTKQNKTKTKKKESNWNCGKKILVYFVSDKIYLLCKENLKENKIQKNNYFMANSAQWWNVSPTTSSHEGEFTLTDI